MPESDRYGARIYTNIHVLLSLGSLIKSLYTFYPIWAIWRFRGTLRDLRVSNGRKTVIQRFMALQALALEMTPQTVVKNS